jgi:hypothetical protein
MGEKEISEFLSYMAVEENAGASTQYQTLSALLFPYREFIHGASGPCAGRVFSCVEYSSFGMNSSFGLSVGNQRNLGRMAVFGQDTDVPFPSTAARFDTGAIPSYNPMCWLS